MELINTKKSRERYEAITYDELYVFTRKFAHRVHTMC